MNLNRKTFAAILCGLIVAIGFFGIKTNTANAQATSTTSTPLTLEQLQEIVDSLKEQIQQLIVLINQKLETAAAQNTSANCEPMNCISVAYDCGEINDGCGNTLNCGVCGTGKTCSSGKCKAATATTDDCEPKNCTSLGYECGTASNGCGTTLNCGICGTGKVCTSGKCKTATATETGDCKPKNCVSLGYECGTVSNGCDTNLNCGICGTGKTCSSGKCAATATAANEGKRCVTVPTCKTGSGQYDSATNTYKVYCDGAYVGSSSLTEKEKITTNSDGSSTVCFIDLNSSTSSAATTVAAAQCGNSKCETGETTLNCAADCKAAACAGTGSSCGSKTNCCSGYTCKSKPDSEGTCVKANTCGNGICEPLYNEKTQYIGETSANCAADCGNCISVSPCTSPNLNAATSEIICDGKPTGKKITCTGSITSSCNSGSCNYCCVTY